MTTLFNQAYYGLTKGLRWFGGSNTVKFEPQPGTVYLGDFSGGTKLIDTSPCLEIKVYADKFAVQDIINQE